jgi:hypothetical protein
MTGGTVVFRKNRKEFCCWYEWRIAYVFDKQNSLKRFVLYGNGCFRSFGRMMIKLRR